MKNEITALKFSIACRNAIANWLTLPTTYSQVHLFRLAPLVKEVYNIITVIYLLCDFEQAANTRPRRRGFRGYVVPGPGVRIVHALYIL